MNAREAILGRIRQALGRGAISSITQTSLESRMFAPPQHSRPQWPDSLRARFIAKLAANAAELTEVQHLAQVPAAVAAYVRLHKLSPRVAVAPALRAWSWPAEVLPDFGPAQRHHQISVTPCFAAIAETGSVVLLSGPHSPTSLNFLPTHHLVVVQRSQLLSHLEDLWPLLRNRNAGMPRAVNLINGPSRTADIEQTLQLGAHGPCHVRVILCDTPAADSASAEGP